MRVTINGSGAILTHGDSLSGAGVIEFPVNEPPAFDDTLAAYTVTGSAPSRKLRFQGHEIAVETPTSTAERAPVTAAGAGTLEDPGNVWEPDVAVVEGYRIVETMQGALRVFEVTVAGTTDAGSAWTDYTDAGSLAPLATTITGSETWQYLGVVGELPWDIVPLAGMGVDGDGFHVDAANPVSEAATMFQLLPSLGDPGNSWQAGANVAGSDRISVTVGGALRVFEASVGTTGGSEPTWLFGDVGQTTSDGSAAWTYRGIVGGPDSSRPVFVTNTAGDADWFLDLNNGSGFRFNFTTDGVPEPSAGSIEFTPDGFKVNAPGGGRFFVNLDPFFVEMLGLPTTDPGAGHAGQLYSNGVPSAGVPKALMVSGG
jgi:hypothetical protein